MRGVWGNLSRVGAFVLAFGGTVGAVGNFRCHDSFTHVVVNTSLDSRVNDYVNLVKATKPIVRSHDPSAKTLRQVSDLWINSYDKGKISQIFPGYYGESLIDGPKGDIFLSCTGLANLLSETAENEMATNDTHAMDDAIRSIELIEIVRFGSYEALFTSSGYLRRPLKILKPNLDKLSASERDRLVRVQNPKTRESKSQLLDEVIHHLKVQYACRYGDEMTKQDDPSYASYAKHNGAHIAAEHFYGFDREIGLQTALKKQPVR